MSWSQFVLRFQRTLARLRIASRAAGELLGLFLAGDSRAHECVQTGLIALHCLPFSLFADNVDLGRFLLDHRGHSIHDPCATLRRLSHCISL